MSDVPVPEVASRPADPARVASPPRRVLASFRDSALPSFVLGIAVCLLGYRAWESTRRDPAPAPAVPVAAPATLALEQKSDPAEVKKATAPLEQELAEIRRELDRKKAEFAELERLRALEMDREQKDRQAREDESRKFQALMEIQRLQFERMIKQQQVEGQQASLMARRAGPRNPYYAYPSYAYPQFFGRGTHLGTSSQVTMPITGE